jgi:hypothetical protein
VKDIKDDLGAILFYRYINFALKAELREHAENAYIKFKLKYPDSLLIQEIESLFNTSKPALKEPLQIDMTRPSQWWVRIYGMFHVVITDRLFWPLSFITLSGALLLNRLPQYHITAYIHIFYIIAFPLILSFILTLGIKTILSLSGGIYDGQSKTETQGLKGFNRSFFMDKAISCENENNLEGAEQYLKAVIKEDAKNLEARYKLARLYHKKLNQPLKAIHEYRILFKTSPKNHHYKRDAHHAIKELSHMSS